MLSISSPGPNRKRKDSQSPASATAAEANAAEALAGLSSYTERDTQAHGGADGANSSHSDTQTDTACPAGQEHSAEAAADDQQPQQARKRRRRIKQTTQPADDAIGAAAAGPGSSDPPVVAEGCKHASGVAKRVVEAPDGSCSVELAHKLSSKSAATNNFWLHLPSNLARRCFREEDLPCDVDILLTVDGENPEPERSGRIKSTVRRRPGRSEYYIAGCSSALSAYKNYTVSKMSVNSSASELTLHLQSPSVMEAAAAAEQEEVAAAVEAARADAAASGFTGWHECKGTKKVITPTIKRSLLRVPAALVSKVYPVPLPAKFKVDLTCYKDNKLVGTRLGAALTPDRKNYEKSSYSVLLSEELQHQLAGCAVICHRGASPNHLQICFSSGRQEQPNPANPAANELDNNPAPGQDADVSPAAAPTAAAPATTAAAASATATPGTAAATRSKSASAPHGSNQHCKHLGSVETAVIKRSMKQHDETASCRWFPWASVRQKPTASAAEGGAASGSAAVPAVCRLGGIRGVNGAAVKAEGCGRQQQVPVLQLS